MTITPHRSRRTDRARAEHLTRLTAEAAQEWLTARALNLAAGQWRNPDVRDRMATALANAAVTITGPGQLTAAMPATADGAIWHYLAHDALRATTPRHTRLTMTNAHTWAATWETHD